MVFCEKGNILRMMTHATSSMTMTIGTITIIQSPKLSPMFSPVGSLSTL